MKRLLSVCCFLFVCSALLWAQGQRTTITAQIADNPSIGIVSFSGTPEAKAELENALRRSGWFRVLTDDKASSAAIRLEAVWDGSQFTGRVTTSGKEPIAVQGKQENAKVSAFAFTDDILKKMFRVPALCMCRIAYVLQGKNNKKEIFTCWLDGSGQQRLTNNNAISTEPAWGHHGALVYTLAKDNNLSVVLVDVDRQRQRVVSKARGLNASAALSRDGRFLALPMSQGGRVDLFVKDLSTGKAQRLTNDTNVDSSPCWSPDCKKICYVSDKLGRPQLFIVPIEGGAARRLQLGGNECVSPDWSPVSNKLCFTMRSNTGQYVIAVIDMADERALPEIVTGAAGDWEAPSWAPDGRHLVCTRTSGRNRDLYIVDTWLKTFVPISKNGNLSLPAWSPR